jgi:UDP-glucuronate 4-epimerase
MMNESDKNKAFLITGAAGFVGYYLSKRLLEDGYRIVGIDNLNDYYDVRLKEYRNDKLKEFGNYTFEYCDISQKEDITALFKKYQPTYVINLAAQAGVRYSIDHPDVYIQNNIVGLYNIVEACRHSKNLEHFLFASSSSVYGTNDKVPFEESDFVDHPVSLYAATKKSNELVAYTYSHLYNIPTTGLRFFTVYGPMGRPDMAYFSFLNNYFMQKPIHIFNNGDFHNDLYRDFTYIDDIVEGICRIIDKKPEGKNPYQLFNIGGSQPVKLMAFIYTLENCLSNSLGRKVEFEKVFEPMKPGDVPKTYASTKKLEERIHFKPTIPIQEGLQKFTDWYVEYYNKK